MNTIDSRNLAYMEVQPKLPKKRKYVYEKIQSYGTLSPQLLSEIANRNFNEIAPRFTELRESGHIKISYHATNPETGNKNGWYSVTTEDERIGITNRMREKLEADKSDLINDYRECKTIKGKETLIKEVRKIQLKIKNLEQ